MPRQRCAGPRGRSLASTGSGAASTFCAQDRFEELFAFAKLRSNPTTRCLNDRRIGLIAPLVLAVLAHRMRMRRLPTIWKQLLELGRTRVMCVITLSNYIPTSSSIRKALDTSDIRLALRTPARRLPMNNQFVRPIATRFINRST
jgi:hypothetical protein